MALIVTIYYVRKIELNYALSWWAFTFPSGALCVSSGVVWKISNFSSIYVIYMLSLTFLLLVWGIVFAQTARRMMSGEIFTPAH